MGMYDTILVPCPKCEELYQAQTKGGDCLLNMYDFNNAPEDAMDNVNRHAPFTCFKCKTVFHVEFNPIPKIVETDDVSDGFDFPAILKNSSEEEIKIAYEEYVSKLDKK